MTMRAIPPPSSPLPDRPIPAPPPMIGSPRRAISWNLRRRFFRSGAAIVFASRRYGPEIFDERRREFRIVDMERQTDEPPAGALLEPGFHRREQSRVRLPSVQRLARPIE